MSMDALERDAAPSHAAAHVAPDADAALAWPPPLLEPLLGAAWRIASAALAGGVLLVVPLLYRLTGEPAAARVLGGVPQWLPELVAAVGLLLLALAASRARRALVAARAALAAGHGRLTVLEVAADRRGDTGFAIAGEREYRELPLEARTLLRVTRLAAAALALLAALLPVGGFLTTVLLAYAGAAEARGAWMLTFGVLPAVGGLALSALALESLLLSGPRRRWAADAGAALAPAVAAWSARFDEAGSTGPGRGRPGGTAVLRVLSPALLLIVCTATAYALLFDIAAFRARALVDAATPRFDAARIAGVEAARPYRLPSDPTISAEAAGEALHAIVMRSHTDRDPLFRAPVRSYDRGRPRPAAPALFPTPVPGPDWVRVAAAGLTPDQATYLRDLAADPASAEISILARAAAIDVAGTRYVTPFPSTMTEWMLPLARTSAARTAIQAHFARALLALHAGRAAEAEIMLREILSAGVLLADEAPFTPDALLGVHTAALGLASLGAFYDVTGRSAEAAHVARLSDAVRRAAAINGGGRHRADDSTLFTTTMSARVLDPDVPRALRWEFASAHIVVSECGSLRHRLFGESAAYREWKEKARAALVRSPGEEALFDLMLETPVRADLTPRGALGRAAALAARLIPGGPRCSAIWMVV